MFVHSIVGVDCDEVPPVPIPNTEVKLIGAEDTWLEAARENRLMPTPAVAILRTYSSLAQSVEHAAVNRRVVCSSQTGGAKHLLGCVVYSGRVSGVNYMKSGPLAQLVRATGS